MLDNKHILLGVCGGIAAYKVMDLASKLDQAGAAVRTIMTESACRLVGPKGFEAITRGPVFLDLWSNAAGHDVEHISLVEWADGVVVAPATANIIGKIAGGICDDLLSTVMCVCWQKPVLLAPAMNTRMWVNPVVQRNVRTVVDMGFRLVGPAEGRLACGDTGLGRMAEPAQIIEAMHQMLSGTQ